MNNVGKDRKILVTGAGYVGSEAVKALLSAGATTVRVLDNSEQKLFELEQTVRDEPRIRLLYGELRDKERVARALEDIEIVVHTAGMKHVLICEYNPFEAVKTNIVGTQNLVEASINAGVERFLFTSSDKAVSPENVLGASKLLAERLVIAGNFYKGERQCKFACLRFGNLLGSSGSVVPLFREQIRRGEPLVVTNPSMTRFILSREQMVRVLLGCLEHMRGGEIFVPKMPAFTLGDLAEVMEVELNGREGKSRLPRRIIGMRPGETLHEDLLTAQELQRAVDLGWVVAILPDVASVYNSRVAGEYAGTYDKPPTMALNSSSAKQLTKTEILGILRGECWI